LWEYDALKAAFRTAALVRNPRGKPMNINLDTLIVSKGYAVHHRAQEMIGAMKRGYMPGTADWDGSAISTFKIVASPWILSNNSYWWMIDSSMKNLRYGLQYKESQPMQLEGPNIVFRTGEIQYRATMIKRNVIAKFSLIVSEAQQWVTRAKDKILSTLNDLARELQFLEKQKSELYV